MPDPLQSHCSIPLSISPSVLLIPSASREGASVDQPGEIGRSGGEEDGARGREAWERWERVGRSPDFLRGRGCWRSRDARMRRGTRTRRGRACVHHRRSRGCSTFFSVTGRRCVGHRRRR